MLMCLWRSLCFSSLMTQLLIYSLRLWPWFYCWGRFKRLAIAITYFFLNTFLNIIAWVDLLFDLLLILVLKFYNLLLFLGWIFALTNSRSCWFDTLTLFNLLFNCLKSSFNFFFYIKLERLLQNLLCFFFF